MNPSTDPDNISNSSTDSSQLQESPKQLHIDIHNTDDIELGEIHEENTLFHYTESHFTHIANTDLRRLRDEYAHTTNDCSTMIRTNISRCDSPMTISNYGSRSGSSNNSDGEDNMPLNPPLSKQLSLDDIAHRFMPIKPPEDITNAKRGYPRRRSKLKQLAFHDVEKMLDKYYDMEFDNKYSSELDILTTFMKGQKNVYIQSKQLAQWRYNCLMIPSLLITCGVTIFTDFVKCDGDNKWIITALNATIGLLIALMNFLKLESSTTMYLQLANHYDKLEV